MIDAYDNELKEWAQRNKYVRRLWRFESSEPKDLEREEEIDVAIDIDRTEFGDSGPLASWMGDADEIKVAITNATNCNLRLGLYHPAHPKLVRDVDTTGILLYSIRRPDASSPAT